MSGSARARSMLWFVISGMAIASTSALVLSGCYQGCERRGEVRCDGDTAQLCGPSSIWEDAVNCKEAGAECSQSVLSEDPNEHCQYPKHLCAAGQKSLCVGDALALCTDLHRPAHLSMSCANGCEAHGKTAECNPVAPSSDAQVSADADDEDATSH